MISIARSLILGLLASVVVGCVGSKTIAEYDYKTMTAHTLSCGELRGEMRKNERALERSELWRSSAGLIWQIRAQQMFEIQEDYDVALSAAYERKCVQGPKTVLEREIEHVDEKLDIEREERRHGELIEAIHSND